jgi:hypothetical protein
METTMTTRSFATFATRFALLTTTVLAGLTPALLTGCASEDELDPAAPVDGFQEELAYETVACDPAGTTLADAELATHLNALLHRDMHGNMSAYRMSCARRIFEATQARHLHTRAAVIAITTSIVETHLSNVSVELDHDSLGLFQQRASWGTRAQRLDAVWATNAFLNKMLHLYPGDAWMTSPIGEVAQDVQVSAFPARYQVQAADAQIIVNALIENGGASTPRTDVTGDGNGDLVIHGRNDAGVGSLYVFQGNDTGFWETPKVPFASSAFMGTVELAVADVTGDGFADTVLARPKDDSSVDLHLIKGGSNPSGLGTFIRTFGAPLDRIQMAAGDVNGDGHADLVIHAKDDAGNATLYVFQGNDTGFWQTPLVPFASSAFMSTAKIAVTDVTGDGADDILLARAKDDTSVDLYMITGGAHPAGLGSFIRTFGAPLDRIQLAAGDVTGDGHGDMVVHARDAAGNATLYVFQGNDTGFWQTAKVPFASSAFMGTAKITVTDVTGDGAEEILLARPKDDDSVDIHMITGGASPSGLGTFIRTFGASLANVQLG